jgi:hypothetical protein
MTDIAAGLAAYTAGKGQELLYQACQDPPRGPAPGDPLANADPEPISSGPDFDDVTAAWIAGTLPDDVYQECVARASGRAPSGSPRSQ